MFSPCRCNAEGRRSVRLASYISLGLQDVGTTTELVKRRCKAAIRGIHLDSMWNRITIKNLFGSLCEWPVNFVMCTAFEGEGPVLASMPNLHV